MAHAHAAGVSQTPKPTPHNGGVHAGEGGGLLCNGRASCVRARTLGRRTGTSQPAHEKNQSAVCCGASRTHRRAHARDNYYGTTAEKKRDGGTPPPPPPATTTNVAARASPLRNLAATDACVGGTAVRSNFRNYRILETDFYVFNHVWVRRAPVISAIACN